MMDVLSDAKAEKNQAKVLRRGSPPDLQGAIDALKHAISLLEKASLPEPPQPFEQSDREVAKELADCWGTLGGTYRANGNLAEAYRCYDIGLKYEADPRLRQSNSYNLVNRLLVRYAMNPDRDPLPGDVEPLTAQLQKARAVVTTQARGPRKGDMWAHADSVLLNLLSGDIGAAKQAFKEFDTLAIIEYAYLTTRDTWKQVANASPVLSESQRSALQVGIQWFENAIQQESWKKAYTA